MVRVMPCDCVWHLVEFVLQFVTSSKIGSIKIEPNRTSTRGWKGSILP